MKRICPLMVLSIVSFELFPAEAEEKVKSKIENVTVFLNGAEVTRSGQVNLKAGINTVVFSNVSKKIEKSSIQASSSAGALVVNTDYQTVYVTSGKKDSLKIEKLTDSIEAANKEIRRLNSLIKTYEATKAVIDDNSQLRESGTASITAVEVQKYSDLYFIKLMEINKQFFC